VLCSGICDVLSNHAGPWRKRVWACAVGTCNLVHIESANNERIRNQRAVAPPRHGLRAHDRRPPTARHTNQLPEGSFELRGLHVVGKAGETRISPGCIDGVAVRMSQNRRRQAYGRIEYRHSQGMQTIILVELRVVP